jgi:hypothetical protein
MDSAQESSIQLSDHAPAYLGAEHLSLTNARGLAWNEAFSRVAVFLNTLSASAVALALVADASGFDDQFDVFALVLFPIVLFLGLATYVRIVQINLQDSYFIAAMNRLRHAYVEDAPEIRKYFTSGISDDEAGIWSSYLLERPSSSRSLPQLLATTPTVVGTLDAVIATVGAAGLAIRLGTSGLALVVISLVVFVGSWAALFSVQTRAFKTAGQVVTRFPSAG